MYFNNLTTYSSSSSTTETVTHMLSHQTKSTTYLYIQKKHQNQKSHHNKLIYPMSISIISLIYLQTTANWIVSGAGCWRRLACEVSNNAVVGGLLCSCFMLGDPATPYRLYWSPGWWFMDSSPPTLFQENAETVYSFIFSLLIANVAFIPIGILVPNTASNCWQCLNPSLPH